MFGHVAATALRERFSVVATARHETMDCVRYEADSPDAELTAVAQRARSDALIVNAIATTAAKMAAASAPERAYSVNATFPHRLAAVAASQGQRVVHISTDAVFPPYCGPVSEDCAVAPQDAYGRSKADGELTAEHCLTIRCSIVGPPAPQLALRYNEMGVRLPTIGCRGDQPAGLRQSTLVRHDDSATCRRVRRASRPRLFRESARRRPGAPSRAEPRNHEI